MAIDLEKRQKRWVRNKRAERDRQKAKPKSVSAAFERRVFRERDWRASHGPETSSQWPELIYLSGSRLERAVVFAADVWAAETLYDAIWGPGKATPTTIREMLKKMGRTHGYTDESLRKLISKARERVKRMETVAIGWKPTEPAWRRFNSELDQADP